MKRPAFQFYTKDWHSNPKLRRCSDAAKGAWIEIMCFLHESDEYGVSRLFLKEIVKSCGVKMSSVRELVEKEVLKGADANVPAFTFTPSHAGKKGEPVTLLQSSQGPMWYCSRFVRDEWIRQRRGLGTRFGDEPKGIPKPEPTRRIGDGTGTHFGDGPAFASAIDSIYQHGVLVASALASQPQPRMANATSTPKASAHSVEKARQAIEESRQAAETRAPMPEHLRALVKPQKPAIQAEPKDDLDL